MSKLDPKEAPPGYQAAPDRGCGYCCFVGKTGDCCRPESLREKGGYCTKEERKDGRDVIFKAEKSETQLFWAKRIVTEEQWFLIMVTKGADKDKILEACLEGDALYGTPHDTRTKQSDTTIKDFEETSTGQYGDPLDLVEETKP